MGNGRRIPITCQCRLCGFAFKCIFSYQNCRHDSMLHKHDLEIITNNRLSVYINLDIWMKLLFLGTIIGLFFVLRGGRVCLTRSRRLRLLFREKGCRNIFRVRRHWPRIRITIFWCRRGNGFLRLRRLVLSGTFFRCFLAFKLDITHFISETRCRG